MRLAQLLQVCLLAAIISGVSSSQTKSHTEHQCTHVHRLCRCSLNTVTCSCAGKFENMMELGNITYPTELKYLKIENCRDVVVQGNAFQGLKHLASIDITNVANLDVEEEGFKWRERFDLITPMKGIIINLTNVTIEELPASSFSGNLDAVIMTDVQINNMRTFAFTDVWKIGRIEMRRFKIGIMEESVAKKMDIKTFIMTNGAIRSLVPSRAFTDINVESEFTIENVKFDIIQSKAFTMRIHKEMRMRSCVVAQLRAEAFVLSVHDNVVFERNVFGSIDRRSIAQITPDRSPPNNPSHHGVTFIFENNTIGDFQDGALEIQDGFRKVQMERVVLQRTCNCADLEEWRRRLLTAIPTGKPGSKMLDASALWCHDEPTRGRRRPTSIEDYYGLACINSGWDLPAVLITAALIGAALLCVVGAGTLCCRRHRQKTIKREANNGIPLKRVNSSKRTPGDGASHIADGKAEVSDETRPLKMIVPDGRTYRETELHVIVERAEPLEELTERVASSNPPRRQS